MTNFLLEIGTEELPAAPLLKELPRIKDKWLAVLGAYGAQYKACEFYYTPRRLVFLHSGFAEFTQDEELELIGPSVQAAFANGKPTQAALGFAKKCGASVQDLGTKTLKDKEVLYFIKRQEGKKIEDCLADMIRDFLKSLNFGKQMRWGTLKDEFIRPVKWFLALLDGRVLNFSLFGLRSGGFTYGHRNYSFDALEVQDLDGYEAFLGNVGVILDAAKRREMILAEIARIEAAHGVQVELDKDLLDELTAITEYPRAILGEFDAGFLRLPKEVIITSMKDNQRYFAVFENGKLANKFVCIANSLSQDLSLIKSGNERVLKPRLKDAEFFWDNDLRRGLSNDGLESVTYAKDLGSIKDKVEREKRIAKELCAVLGEPDGDLQTCIDLSKADLISDMVYEFTSLQGVMGHYYARRAGYDEKIALAIREQYMPLNEDAPLPSSRLGALASIVTKLDSLMALFSVGKIPSGSKDPLSLRRMAIGLIKVIINERLAFDLAEFLKRIAGLYKPFDTALLSGFINERLYNIFGTNPSLVKAVLGSNAAYLWRVANNIEILSKLTLEPDFKEKFSTFKRVANIIKDADLAGVSFDESLLKDEAEIALFRAFSAIPSAYDESKLAALFALKEDLERFFASVMVNDKDEKIKKNRQVLLFLIYAGFLDFADLKELSI